MVSRALGLAKVTVPGPSTWLHVVVTAPGGSGSPSSGTVPVRLATSGRVTVGSPAAITIGRPLVWNSTWSSGALGGSPSNDSAVRSPLPVMTITSELPLIQPERFTISWMTEDISGVLWSGPAASLVGQAGGDQATDAEVMGRDETFPLVPTNVAAVSTSSPWMVNDVASLVVSSVSN